jgi:hypothetical protein
MTGRNDIPSTGSQNPDILPHLFQDLLLSVKRQCVLGPLFVILKKKEGTPFKVCLLNIPQIFWPDHQQVN